MESRGQLKVHIFAHYGLLTVHILQGRSLVCKTSDICNAYIKLSLTPDHSRRARCKTETISNTSRPVFNEKFSFELLEEDLRKRLLVSVWHKNAETSHSEFLGCMSFGIQNIVSQSKTIAGWYHMLDDSLGQRKHLAAAVLSQPQLPSSSMHGGQSQPPSSSRGSSDGQSTVTDHSQEHPTPMPMSKEAQVFVLRRGAYGYGFGVTGDSPCTVGRVEPGSPAESMGLVSGDAIVRINGMNVAHFHVDTVSRLLQSCEDELVLEIERYVPSKSASFDPRQPLSSTMRHPANTDTVDCMRHPGSTAQHISAMIHPANSVASRDFGATLPRFNSGHQRAAVPGSEYGSHAEIFRHVGNMDTTGLQGAGPGYRRTHEWPEYRSHAHMARYYAQQSEYMSHLDLASQAGNEYMTCADVTRNPTLRMLSSIEEHPNGRLRLKPVKKKTKSHTKCTAPGLDETMKENGTKLPFFFCGGVKAKTKIKYMDQAH